MTALDFQTPGVRDSRMALVEQALTARLAPGGSAAGAASAAAAGLPPPLRLEVDLSQRSDADLACRDMRMLAVHHTMQERLMQRDANPAAPAAQGSFPATVLALVDAVRPPARASRLRALG